ncbi:LysR family transcriptional regulator (plasmid) [Paraburkholderia sp. 22B1P]|nr:LysR family transcriptional regulator [Paraburkholderia sp. 22B1P]
MTITPLGERLLRHARIILRQVDHAKSEISEFTGDDAGHVRIFAHTTAASEVMPQVLASFMATRRQVTVDLQERLKKDILRGVLEGTTDLGLVAGPIAPADYQIIPWTRDRMVLVTQPDHPLATNRKITFSDIAKHPIVALHDSSSYTEFLWELGSEAHVPLNIRTQMRSFDAMCKMIEAGVGIGLVPEGPARRYQKSMRIQLVPVEEVWAERARSIVVRDIDALPGCARALIRHILDSSMQAPVTTT